MSACWKALSAQAGVELRVYAFGNNQETAFDLGLTKGLDIHWVSRTPNKKELLQEVISWEPEVIVLCGWFVPAYRNLAFAKEFRTRPSFILTMDTPWQGTGRQQIGRLLLKNFISKMAAVMTSGERSYQYARRLGAHHIAKVQYGVDAAQLKVNYETRKRKQWPRKFLYIGRYAAEKGIDLLIPAYQNYRLKSEDPWELHTCGKGQIESLIQGEGIVNHGFVQPGSMNEVWQEAGCLVLPSTFDPWPLIVVEACAAGLPVICTHASGSQVEVVKMYWNGLVINENSVRAIAEALHWMHENHDSLPEMGRRSIHQAAPYEAKVWSEKFLHLISGIHDQ